MKKKNIEKLSKKLNISLDNEDRAILNIKISDDSNFLSPFYFENPLISDDVAGFIVRNKRVLLWKYGISIHLYCDSIQEEKKQIYENAIKTYFSDLLIYGKRKQKRNYFLAIILFFIGVLIFSLLFILDFLIGDSLGMWSEVIDVIAWVFIWEAVDITIIESLENKSDVVIAKNIVNSKVKFIGDPNLKNKNI